MADYETTQMQIKPAGITLIERVEHQRAQLQHEIEKLDKLLKAYKANPQAAELVEALLSVNVNGLRY